MKKILYRYILALFILLLSGCSQVSGGTYQGDIFYSAIKALEISEHVSSGILQAEESSLDMPILAFTNFQSYFFEVLECESEEDEKLLSALKYFGGSFITFINGAQLLGEEFSKGRKYERSSSTPSCQYIQYQVFRL